LADSQVVAKLNSLLQKPACPEFSYLGKLNPDTVLDGGTVVLKYGNPVIPCNKKGKWVETGLVCRVSCMERSASAMCFLG
jgi:hypothetical protein